jgi:hypothetical protein
MVGTSNKSVPEMPGDLIKPAIKPAIIRSRWKKPGSPWFALGVRQISWFWRWWRFYSMGQRSAGGLGATGATGATKQPGFVHPSDGMRFQGFQGFQEGRIHRWSLKCHISFIFPTYGWLEWAKRCQFSRNLVQIPWIKAPSSISKAVDGSKDKAGHTPGGLDQQMQQDCGWLWYRTSPIFGWFQNVSDARKWRLWSLFFVCIRGTWTNLEDHPTWVARAMSLPPKPVVPSCNAVASHRFSGLLEGWVALSFHFTSFYPQNWKGRGVWGSWNLKQQERADVWTVEDGKTGRCKRSRGMVDVPSGNLT